MSYCIFKHEFALEKYLSLQIENKYKVALTRFRTSSHDLFLETRRYDRTDRNLRICKSCNMSKIEDEFHFLLVCPMYRELRRKYLKAYFCHWPTFYKFDILLSSTSFKTVLNLSKFICYENPYFINFSSGVTSYNFVRYTVCSFVNNIMYYAFIVYLLCIVAINIVVMFYHGYQTVKCVTAC